MYSSQGEKYLRINEARNGTPQIQEKIGEREDTPTEKLQERNSCNNTISRPLLPQMVIMGSSYLGALNMGMTLSHSAVLLPHLKADNSSFTVDEETGSEIASMCAMAAPVGFVIGGILMDIGGRRTTMILGNAFFTLGWLIIALSENVGMLLSGRIVDGLAKGIACAPGLVFIDEVMEPKVRAFFAASVMPFHFVGGLVIIGLGTLLHWRVASSFPTFVNAFLVLVTLFFIPESPSWLIRKNRLKEARNSLNLLWGPGREIQVDRELNRLLAKLHVDEQNLQPAVRCTVTSVLTHISNTCHTLFKPCMIKPFLISSTFLLIQVFCGQIILVSYTVDIVSEVQGKEQWMDSYIASLCVMAAGLLSSLMATYVLLKFGRRKVAIGSGIGSFASTIILSVILYLENTTDVFPDSAPALPWIKIILILVYFFSYAPGFFTLSILMTGELLPAKIRGFSFGSIFAINELAMGGIIKSYPWLNNNLGIAGLFLFFGISCIVCTVFVFLFLPETNGQTLEAIEEYFRQTNYMWITRKHRNLVPENESDCEEKLNYTNYE